MDRRSGTSPRLLLVVAALCAAAAVAGFALGRAAPAPQAPPAPEELAAAIRTALGQGDALERLRRSTDLLEHLGPGNLVEVAAVYDQMRPVIADWEVRPFVAAWARVDPGDAFEHTLAWPARGRREVGVEVALEGWAAVDPAAAREAFERASAQQPKLRGDLLRGLVTGWVRSGPVPEALRGLDGFLVGVGPNHQDDGIRAAVQELVRGGGAEAVLAWVDPILRDASDRPRFKESLFRISLRALARWDPERGSAWAAQHMGKDYAEVGPLLVGGQWGARNGAAALAWLRDLPEGEARDRGVHRAMVRWLRADPAAARDWLDAQSLELFHAPAIEAYAEELVKQAPEDALGWCDRIPDPERGGRCVQDVAGRWYRQDAAAAEAWLEQSPLDEEARSAVRQPARRRPAGAEGLRAGTRSR